MRAPRSVGVALAVAGLLTAFAGILPAVYNPLNVCDRTDAPRARLVNSHVESLFPATVGCTWAPYSGQGEEVAIIEQGEEFHESLPINQVGQLVGAAAVGGGLALLGVAAASRRHRRWWKRHPCPQRLPILARIPR